VDRTLVIDEPSTDFGMASIVNHQSAIGNSSATAQWFYSTVGVPQSIQMSE
jgi:hypothetical protein